MTTKHKSSSFKGRVGKDAQKQKTAGASYGYLNLPKGTKIYNAEENTRKVLLDFLPYLVSDPKHPNHEMAPVGSLWYKRPFKIHRNVGADNDTVVCPKSIGKPCPICDYQKKRFAEGADKEETTELYAKSRNLYIVVPIEQKDFDEIPHVWDMSQKLFQDILNDELEEDENNEVFPDLEEGKTLEITFAWEKLGRNTFPKARKIKFFDRDPYEETILDEVPDLDKLLTVLSYEELSNKFFELEEDETGGKLTEIEEEPVSRKRRTPRPEAEETETPRRRRPVPVETEKEKPKSFRRSREPEKEPEVDEKPVRHSTRKTSPEPPNTGIEKKCPHGHEFGTDTEKFDACDKCTIWADCMDEKEGK